MLKVVIHDFIKSNVESGKTRFLDHVKSIVSGQWYDCFGSEYEQCLQVFKSVWRLELYLECSSPHCPRPKNTRYPNGYNLQPQSLENFSDQIKKQFPENGQALGCGATFPYLPPKDASSCHRRNIVDLKDNDGGCNGTPVVKKCVFFSKHPWLIPFNIISFKKELLKELDELPVILHLLG